MARAQANRQAVQAGRKSAQRERLIAAMIAVANRDGYAGTTVAAVTAQAKVSKPTFYEYFRDRDDCFVAALAEVQSRILDYVRDALDSGQPHDAVTDGIGAVLAFASSQPELARFLTNEPLGASPAGLDARDNGLDEIADTIEARLTLAPPDAQAPDFTVVVVLGGLYRLLAARLRRGEHLTTAFGREILDWIALYAMPMTEHRWRSMTPLADFEPPTGRAPAVLQTPEALPPGRPKLSAAGVQANQRLRIIDACASLAAKKGYLSTTVNEIVRRARVDLRVFYSLFSDKQEAFLAAQELGAREAMAATAAGFYESTSWPEQGWGANRAFLQFLETNAIVGRLAIIEAYAAGAVATKRVEDGYVPFIIFYQEGLRLSSRDRLPGPVGLEAIVATYFEIVYRQVRASHPPKVLVLLPNIAGFCFTPFLGPSETNRFIDGKVRSSKKLRHASPKHA